MRRVLARLIPSPALGLAIVALVLAAGGITYAATSSESVIRACANKRTGVLRIAKRCKRNERRVTWGVVGPQGRQGVRGFTGSRGFSGATGTGGAPGKAGPTGPEGPQGPGATTFSTTVNEGQTLTLATLSNGVIVTGTCNGTGPQVTLATASGKTTLQASGTAATGTELTSLDINGGTNSTIIFKAATTTADFDGLARDSSVAGGKFAHLDVHGHAGPPCQFWGMTIASS
jgi:hypothetical protein